MQALAAQGAQVLDQHWPTTAALFWDDSWPVATDAKALTVARRS
jgi:hypothetical protein